MTERSRSLAVDRNPVDCAGGVDSLEADSPCSTQSCDCRPSVGAPHSTLNKRSMPTSLPRFQIDITGPNPEDVSVGELTDFLRSLEQAVSSVAGEEADPIRLRLVSIEQGSDRLTVAVPADALPNIALITSSIEENNFDDLPRPTHEALRNMSKVTKRNNWGFRFVENKNLDIRSAAIDAGAEIPAPVVTEVKGVTSILAKCMRSGGAVAPRVELRLPNRATLLHVDVSENLARELGSRLYEDVVLSGEATWNSYSWEIVSFTVASISPYESTPVDVSFRQLAEVSREAWDGVDANAFVREQREERSD